MRRTLIVRALSLALIAIGTVVGIFVAAPSVPQTAFAGAGSPTPTPSPTPFAGPTVVRNYGFLNNTTSYVQGIDILTGPYISAEVNFNPAGCPAPTIQKVYVQTLSVFGLLPGAPANVDQFRTEIRWPSGCMDPGEMAQTRMTIPDDPWSAALFAAGIDGVPSLGFLPAYGFVFSSDPTATATSTPLGGTNFIVEIDCDLSTPGVQASCAVPVDAGSTTVGIVVTNNGPSRSFGALGFELFNTVVTRLDAVDPACASPGLNCNPDFQVSGGSWTCGPPFPLHDTAPGTPQISRIGCYTFSSVGAPTLPSGSTTLIGSVTYAIPGAAPLGSTVLRLTEVSGYDATFDELYSCRPTIFRQTACHDAEITIVGPAGLSTPTPSPVPQSPTATPTSAGIGVGPSITPSAPYYLVVDCDARTPGYQSSCTYPLNAGFIDVSIRYYWSGMGDIAALGFKLKNPDRSRLMPLTGADLNLDANPDFNDQLLGQGFLCGANPAPNADTGEGGPTQSFSTIGCQSGLQHVVVPTGSELATIRYGITTGAQAGSVELSLPEGVIYGDSIPAGSIRYCEISGENNMPCISAQISLVEPSSATPTASPTALPPGIAKIPEGNANNTDLTIPAANLWICEAPAACNGPGEGALRVVERATGVIEELGAYEFTVEYDNFVIQSVNPCDLVFGPGGAGSARGPVDELNSSAENPDCAPDPNNPANGSCAMSLVLENLVHFGCVTSGQSAGPTGDFDLASLLLIPHPDLNNDLFPGNNNGVLTVLKDNGCELVDIFGHPVSGSINGGLTPYCRDLAVTVRILEGDLDLDCDVDLTDAQAIASRYGAFFGGLLYSKWFDLEPEFHDLDIDIKDVQKVFGRQESTCQNPIPAQPPLPPPTAFGD